jgi:hypothetical protein
MTPYRGPRMRQVSSQWEWEEEMEQERAEEEWRAKLQLRRDYCWHRVGWRWEVRVSWLDDAGKAVYTQRVLPYRFWRWRKAARISSAIFTAYLDGRDVQRKASAPSPSQSETP